MNRLSHVALLVPSVDDSAAFLSDRGFNCGEPEVFDAEGTKEVYVGSYQEQAGLLLLVEAVSDGPYRRALNKRGPSLHHVAIDVVDISGATARAESAGWTLHPISTQTLPSTRTAWWYRRGIPMLIEVCERELSELPSLISRIEIPVPEDCRPITDALGLGAQLDLGSTELQLTLADQCLSFSEIARTV